MIDLISFQRRFHRALLSAPEELAEIAPDAARRILVHKQTIESGLVQTLNNSYPAVRRVVGGSAFATLAVEFVAEFPPREPLLSTYGRDFPPFLAAQSIGTALPYLPDLARLEWLRQEAYLAADAPRFNESGLIGADPNALSELLLRLHPATRVLSSRYPVFKIWRLNKADVDREDIPQVDMNTAENVIITRPGDEVATRAVGLADATLIRAIAGGAILNAAVQAAVALEPAFDLTAALAGHFAAGTFANP